MKTPNAAKLPGLPAVTQGNLLQVVQAMVERSEVREGSRGNPNERAVTVRELRDMGFSGFGGGGFGSSSQAGSVLTVNSDGTYSAMTPDAFADSIRKSKLYKDLMKRLDDVTRFDGLPEQVKAILLNDLAAEAAKRGADIQRLEHKMQSATESLAYTVEEVTASVAGSMAGVRETVFASATANNATAGVVTQLVAALDGTGSATAEESLVVIADRTLGLSSQYMLKLNAGKAVTGFGLLASEDPTGLTESKFIIQADQFALTGTYTYMQGDMSSTPPVAEPSAAVAGQTWYNTRTNLSYRAAGGIWNAYLQPIPFGVDMTTNTTYINGQLRVGSAGGIALEDITSGAAGTSYGLAYAYKRSATDLIAPWNAATNGPGAVTWTFSSGSITTPATDALLNGWTKAIPAGTDPLYVTACSAAATTATDSIADAEWATPALLTQNGVNGSNGLNVATAILYQRNSSPTVGPTAQANTVTFTFSTGGMTGMSAGWTTAIPSAASGAYLWVTRATASGTGTTDTLATGEWSAPVLYTQDGSNGTNGSNGSNGDTVDIVFVRSASQPSTPTSSAGTPAAPITWYSNPGSVPASSNPMWSSVGKKPLSSGNYTWNTPIKIDGTAVAEVTVFIRSASAPATPTGGTYAFSDTPAITAPASWSTSVPEGTNPVYTSRCVVSAPSGYTSAITMSGWTAPVLSMQNGTNGTNGSNGATGTRGTIVTKITGAWNATTAAAAVSAIATAAGATPTNPIKGDIVYYTGGANECTVAGSPGTWGAVTAYIDGSLVVTGTIAGNRITAGTMTTDRLSASATTVATGMMFGLGQLGSAAGAGPLGANTAAGVFSSNAANNRALLVANTAATAGDASAFASKAGNALVAMGDWSESTNANVTEAYLGNLSSAGIFRCKALRTTSEASYYSKTLLGYGTNALYIQLGNITIDSGAALDSAGAPATPIRKLKIYIGATPYYIPLSTS